MTTKPIDIIPVPGMREDISGQLAPPGTIALAQNVRWRKEARIEKRYGCSAVSGTQPGDTSTPVGWLGSLQGGLLAGMVNTTGAADSSLHRYSSVDARWVSLGAQAACKPIGSRSIAGSDATTLQRRSAAVAFDTVFVAWDDGTNTHIIGLDDLGSIIWVAPTHTGIGTRLVLANSRLWVISSASTALEVREITASGTTFAVSSATNIGTLSGAGEPFDAAPVTSGTTWVVAYKSAATTVTTKLMVANSVSVTRTTAATATIGHIGVAGQASENIYLAWGDGVATEIRADIFDASLTHVTGPFLVSTGAGNNTYSGQVTWYRIDSTHFRCVWGGYNSTADPAYGFTKFVSIQSNATVGTEDTLWGWQLSSKPFSSGGKYFYWCQTAVTDTSASTSKFCGLFTAASSICHALSTQPRSHYLASNWIPEVVQLDDRWTFVGMTELRSRNLGVTVGMQLYQFSMVNDSTGGNPYIYARQRQAVESNGALFISGGLLQEYIGEPTSRVNENNFPYQPSISLAASAGAGLTAGVTYSYLGVWELIDPLSRRHRSNVSAVKSVTPSGGNLQVTVTYLGLNGSGKSGYNNCKPVLHLYRSWGGGPYYRVTPAGGAPAAVIAGSTTTHVDTVTDANAQTNEILYVDGGVYGNDPPDGCAMFAMGADRAYLVGWDRRFVQVSRIIVPNEPVQFVNDPAFWIPLPDDATGLAYCDGSLVVFTASNIYVVYVDGAGPNDQGQGAFGTLRALPSNAGCIDERSVCVTELGVFYQSTRGIMLVPRGFGASVPVGDGIQDTMASYPIIAGAALVSDGQGERVHFLALSAEAASVSSENVRVLVYDLRLRAWAIDRHASDARIGAIAAVDGIFHYAVADAVSSNGIRYMTSSVYTDLDRSGTEQQFEQRIRLAPIRPNGVMGAGHFQNVGMVGEFIAACDLNLSVSVDGATATVGTKRASTIAAAPLTAGDQMFLAVKPEREYGTAMVVAVYDSEVPVLLTQRGFALDAFSILFNPKPGFRGLNNTALSTGGYGLEQA